MRPGKAIIVETAAAYGVTVEALLGRNLKNLRATQARTEAIKAMRRIGFSLHKIGRLVGRDHSTVCHYLNDALRQKRIERVRLFAMQRRERRAHAGSL